MSTPILKTVLRTLKHYKLLSSNQTLIIGVSGGTDSLALLHILNELRLELGISLHVATLNHGIRGRDAEADVHFVEQIADQCHIPYTAGEADVPQLAAQLSIGIEAAARIARYQFLVEVAKAQHSNVIAVAHHADDQAETILMHMIRGSGLRGLQGMAMSAPVPDHPQYTLIRPLLQVTRQELEQYCADNNLAPRHDETNDNTDYQRNYIRHEIMNRLKNLNPSVTDAFVRLGETAQLDDDFINHQFRSLVMPIVTTDDQRWTIALQEFMPFHEALKRRYILYAVQQLNQQSTMPSTHQIVAAIEMIKNGSVGSILDMGQGIRLRLGYDALFIEDDSHPLDQEGYRLIPEGSEIELSVPSIFASFGIRIIISTEEVIPQSDEKLIILSEKSPLVLRTRKQGDQFKPMGMGGHSRSIKKWMIDRKIPRHIRNNVPILVLHNEILAICVGDQWHLADQSQYIVNGNRKMYLILG